MCEICGEPKKTTIIDLKPDSIMKHIKTKELPKISDVGKDGFVEIK